MAVGLEVSDSLAAKSDALKSIHSMAAATATSGAPAAVMAHALLAPKRKKRGSMERISTMSAFCIDCNCRSSKAYALVSAAAKTQGDASTQPAAVVTCRYYEAQAAARRLQLYSFPDAPAALRFNRHIRSGYRAGYSYPQCCASVLSWHNETGNIWSHLLPALMVLALLAGGQLQAWSGARLAFAANVGSILLCFVGSVLYHTFMAAHHDHDRWLKLDVCGILLVLVGGGHMVLWWGLYCHPTARIAFAIAYYGCGAMAVCASLRASSALQRGLPMLGLLLVRLAALAMRAALQLPGPALQHYVAMEACSLAGGLLNVLRMPERWLQPADPQQAAPLDYLLNSHQIMHVLVAAALWQLHLGAAADYHMVSALQDGSMQCLPTATM